MTAGQVAAEQTEQSPAEALELVDIIAPVAPETSWDAVLVFSAWGVLIIGLLLLAWWLLSRYRLMERGVLLAPVHLLLQLKRAGKFDHRQSEVCEKQTFALYGWLKRYRQYVCMTSLTARQQAQLAHLQADINAMAFSGRSVPRETYHKALEAAQHLMAETLNWRNGFGLLPRMRGCADKPGGMR